MVSRNLEHAAGTLTLDVPTSRRPLQTTLSVLPLWLCVSVLDSSSQDRKLRPSPGRLARVKGDVR